jgi:hypothetical protein
LVSKFAFKCNLYRYTEAAEAVEAAKRAAAYASAAAKAEIEASSAESTEAGIAAAKVGLYSCCIHLIHSA